MKKKIIAVVCACFTFMSVTNTVHATTVAPTVPIITYDGKMQEFYVDDAILKEGKLPDLFTEFKDCMPGDVRTQQVEIKVKNLGSNTAKISLLAEKPDAKYEELMKTVTCQIVNEEQDITKTIWDKIMVADFQKDESKVVTMTLAFPIEMGSEFQNFIGQVDWYLDVEMIPNQTPVTGDNNSVNSFLLVGSLAVALILGVILFKIEYST